MGLVAVGDDFLEVHYYSTTVLQPAVLDPSRETRLTSSLVKRPRGQEAKSERDSETALSPAKKSKWTQVDSDWREGRGSGMAE